MPRKSPLLSMTDLYHTPGGAEKAAKLLSSNPEAKDLFEAGIAYSRGEIDKVYEHAKDFLDRHSGFFAITGAGLLLSFCAIWRGDIELWKEAKKHISSAPSRTATEREIIALVLTAADSSIYDYTSYPQWFEQGNFELLPPDAHPAAKVFYAKYLYMSGWAVASRQMEVEGLHGLALMRLIPNALEPLISQAVVDKTVIPEIQLRLWCATAYHNAGQDEQAIPHIDKAIALALPDRLYGTLAVCWRNLDTLLEERLSKADPVVAKKVKELNQIFVAGQAKLGSQLQNRNITVKLTPREYEIAKLAAFGFTNKRIAYTLGIGESTVKTVVQKIMQKTGLNDRADFVLVI